VDFAKCCSKAGSRSEKEERNLSDAARMKLEILEAVGRAPPNGAKTYLLIYTNTNYLLDLRILLGLFDRQY
jgi:hypothetical protein